MKNRAIHLRLEFGLLLFDIAELLGVCPKQIEAWLNG